MSSLENKAVFLSYASQDAEAAKRICEALRAAGIEVWFDQSELVGGDAWDQKIRKQIKECALLIPVISANTQARREGYFRLEWRLAVERMRQMDDDLPFLLPVVIDDTRDAEAYVPERFRDVQWTRLDGVDVPPTFNARVLRLLGRGEGAASPTRPKAPGQGARAANRRPRRLTALAAGILALGMIGAWIAIRLNSPAPRTASMAPDAALTEGQKLLARVWSQLQNAELGVDNLDAAALLCDRAMALDPTDPVVWAASSEVNSWKYHFAGDNSATVQERARAQAARALSLAPTNFEARRAHATYLVCVVGKSGAADAEAILRALRQERPRDANTLMVLGLLLRDSGRLEEAVACFDELALQPERAARAYNEKAWTLMRTRDYARTEVAIDRSIAAQPTTGNVAMKIFLALNWRGDLELALATLNKLPAAVVREDRGLAAAIRTYRWRREPEQLLALCNNVPRDWITWGIDGPKAAITGDAHEQAGRLAAARADWRKALSLVEQRLKETGNNRRLLEWKAYLLAALGERRDAEETLEVARELPREIGYLLAYDPVTRLDSVEATLTQLEQPAAGSRPLTFAELKLNPAWDHVRSEPRFQALLSLAAQDPTRSLPGPDGKVSTPPFGALAKSVAVLAFANLSDDKANEYFSDGISEELLNVLCKVPGLKVMARTSSFHFKGKDTPIADIAAQLGVAYVVEGSVRKQGDKVRITAQLIKAADGFHVWSDTFTRDLKDIFAVQDEIAGLIAQQLQLKLGESTRVTKVVNPEAYRLVLEGRQFWNLRSEEGFTKAEAAFTKALALDPQFAEAHAGLGGVCVIRSVYRELDAVALDANDLRRAVNEGRRALEIDPSSAEAHAVLGHAQMMGNQLAEADRHYQQALELSPNSALVQGGYALLLSSQGRLDASLLHYQKAAEVDPLWFINLHMLGGELALAQRFDQSLGILERAAALRTGIFLPNLAGRARALLALGRKEEAFEAARHILKHPDDRPRWNSDAVAIRVLWEGGLRQEAGDEVARLLARWPPDFYLRGFVLVAVGRFDEALPYLKHTPSSMLRSLYWESMWDPWRDDPRFAQLLQNFNRAEEYRVARATLARMRKEQEAKK